jgi:DNA-binding transcriptional MerR regulator
MAEKSPFSFSDWYAKHGDELNSDRRARYQTDPEYRARVLELNRQTRERRKAARDAEKKVEQGAVRVRITRGLWKQFGDSSKGEEVLFTVGALARAIGKSVQTVRLWEDAGIIPEPSSRSSKRDRLYTAARIQEIHDLLKSQDRLKPFSTGKRSKIRALKRDVRFIGSKTKRMLLFRIGALARVTGCTVATIKQMEARGWLPKTPLHYSETRYRLYSSRMIAVVRHALLDSKESVGSSDLIGRQLRSKILKGWDKLGMRKARVVQKEASGGRKRGTGGTGS